MPDDAARRELNELLALVTESISDFVVVTDLEGRISHANRAMLERFGYRPEQLRGRLARLLLAPENPPELIERIRRDTAAGGFVGDVLNITADGGTLWVSLRTSLVERDGRPAAMVALSRDISERRLMEQELRTARDLALESARLKAEFLANVSHEIRTPMNAVIGMNRLLLDSGLSPRQREYAEIVAGAAGNLLAIINEILDLSHIEAGKLRLEEHPFDPAAAVVEVVRLLRPAAEERGLELRQRIAADVPPVVLGDGGRFRQVVTNLVGNAVKFTDRGRVEVALRAAPLSPGVVRLEGEVRDTGPGIAPDQVARLFEPFVQADGSATRRHGGTGLGLSIVKRLVEMMGGGVEVESEPGRGSVFRFQIAARLPAPVVRADATASGDGPRVLVVDDNPVNQLVASHQLAELGCRPVAAGGGEEALAAIAEGGLDLVLMDCRMPGLDGFDTTRRLRDAEQPGQRLPVVAMTAATGDEEWPRCRAAGMDAILPKPVELSQLRRVLVRFVALPGSGPGPEPAEGGPAAPGPGLPLVAAERLADLGYGSPQLVPRLVELFRGECERALAELRAAAGAGNLAEVRRVAHRLRGAAGNVGAARAGELVGRIERQAAGSGERSRLEPLLEELATVLAATREELAARAGEAE